MTTYRIEFSEALTLLALAADRLVRRGHPAPVLVGGAAVELYTGGRITSGDFDFVSPWQSEFFAELEAVGFERPQTVGWLKRSLWHPTLKFGVQVVSGSLMDGRADGSKIQVVEVDSSSKLRLRVIPVEDLIADRMAQALAGPRIRDDMKSQAVSLYRFAESLDRQYLDRRIRDETGGEASLETLIQWSTP